VVCRNASRHRCGRSLVCCIGAPSRLQHRVGSPSSDVSITRGCDFHSYEPKQNPLSAQQKRELGKAESQGKKEREKEEEQARIAAAKFFENKLLAAGYSADVFINGPRHTYLTLRYIQFTKAFQYQFEQQEQDTLRSWRDLGFTKITMTDGYDTNSVWNLKR